MLDSAVPSARLIERWIWFASAARIAASDSGDRISTATSSPPNAFGAPSTRMP
jgi:hypothetical protein